MELAPNETVLQMETTHHRHVDMLPSAMNLIGIVANLMIISTVLSSKSLQTRTYLLLMNWSIFDILFKISTDMHLHRLTEQFWIKHQIICVTSNFDMIFLFAEIVFMLALISNWAVKSYTMNDLKVFFIFYAIIASCLFTVLTLCVYKVVHDLIYALVGFSYIVLLIIVTAKGVNRLKKSFSNPLSPDSVKRLNIASIYTNTVLLLFVAGLVIYLFKLYYLIDFIMFTVFLIPGFIHLYLTKADEEYKASFLDLIFCRPHLERPIENVV